MSHEYKREFTEFDYWMGRILNGIRIILLCVLATAVGAAIAMSMGAGR